MPHTQHRHNTHNTDTTHTTHIHTQGSTTLVIPDDVIYDPLILLPYIKKHKATRMLFTPSLLNSCMDAPASMVDVADCMKSLRIAWLCGEVVTVTLQQKVAALRIPTLQLLNLYSISECHDVSVADITLKPRLDDRESKFASCGIVFDQVPPLGEFFAFS